VGCRGGALFGVHPITAESVAWLAERKTLLAAFFALLAMCAHVLYVRARAANPRAAGVLGSTRAASWRICWPCSRSDERATARVAARAGLLAVAAAELARGAGEDPHFVLSGVAAVVTFVVAGGGRPGRGGGGDASHGSPPLVVCHNIVFYLLKVIWPSGLASVYPFPQPFGVAQPMVLLGVVGTLGLGVAAVVLWRRWPALRRRDGFSL